MAVAGIETPALRPATPPAPLGQRVWAWMHQRPTPAQWLFIVTGALMFELAWSALGVTLVAATSSEPAQADPLVKWLMLEAPLAQAIGILALGVLLEELAFRLVPLAIVLRIARRKPDMTWLVPVTVVLAAVAFGLFHGLEWYRLLLQAVGGVALALVYLKTCGMNGRYWLAALATTFLVHLAINSTLMLAMRVAQSAA